MAFFRRNTGPLFAVSSAEEERQMLDAESVCSSRSPTEASMVSRSVSELSSRANSTSVRR